MRELLDIIPYLDLVIGAMLLFFVYVGWKHGVPKLLMAVGAIYTGFLLASVYYHLVAVLLANALNIRADFTTDLVSFVILDAAITGLMLLLLVNLFSHVEVKGRLAVFDKVFGSLIGFFAGALVIGILVALLRVPVEAANTKINSAANMPIVQVFNIGYGRSALAPVFMKAAPYLLRTVEPALPQEAKDKGAVPLLQSIVAGR